MQTVTKKIRAEERVISLREGERIGEIKGELRAARTILLNLATAKFDYVPVGFSQKVNAIEDMTTLNALSTSILKVDSLEAFEALVDKATRPTVH